MAISASHWVSIVGRVKHHAKTIYPNNPKKAEKLENFLLAMDIDRNGVYQVGFLDRMWARIRLLFKK